LDPAGTDSSDRSPEISRAKARPRKEKWGEDSPQIREWIHVNSSIHLNKVTTNQILVCVTLTLNLSLDSIVVQIQRFCKRSKREQKRMTGANRSCVDVESSGV